MATRKHDYWQWQCDGCGDYVIQASSEPGEWPDYQDRGSQSCPYCDAHVSVWLNGVEQR